ncbi:MAG: hypothetical protein ABIS35_04765 [Terracoccus sp.]
MKRRSLALPVPSAVRRTLPALAAGVTAVALTAGCQVFSPVQTDAPYVAADGVPVEVGQLALRDLVLVGDGTGEVVMSGSAINLGGDAMTVQLQPEADPATGAAGTGVQLELKPREQVNLADRQLQFGGVTAKPGALVGVKVTSSTGGTTLAQVPLLPPVNYYSTITPTPVATPTDTATTTG